MQPPAGVSVTVLVSPGAVAPGEPVEARLVLRNDGGEPLDAGRPSTRIGEVAVWQGDTRVAAPEPAMYAQMLVPDAVPPGESRALAVSLAAPGAPGDYEVRGWYDALAGPWDAVPAPLTVLGG